MEITNVQIYFYNISPKGLTLKHESSHDTDFVVIDGTNMEFSSDFCFYSRRYTRVFHFPTQMIIFPKT